MRYFVLFAIASLFAAAAFNVAAPARPSEAAGAILGFPIATCTDADTAQVVFSWTPLPGASQIWVDVSSRDLSFGAGTFDSVGPLAGTAKSYSWPSLVDGQPYAWRVNSRTAAGWVTSDTGAFVPCGSPSVIASIPSCPDQQNPTATIQWAPMTPAAAQQYIDYGPDQNFGAGGFSSAGPLTSGMQSYQIKPRANSYTYFRVNSLFTNGTWYTSQSSSFYAGCGAPATAPGAAAVAAVASGTVDTELYTSNDTLVINGLGINAPVNVRNVDSDGIMGDPAGKDDVVRYDFPTAPGIGGYPGKGGTTVLAGHVDYHPNFTAVFWTLKQARSGMQIDYYRGDGKLVSYTIDWVSSVGGDDDINTYVQSTTPESIVLISCEGSFDAATRHYNNRTVVHGVKIG